MSTDRPYFLFLISRFLVLLPIYDAIRQVYLPGDIMLGGLFPIHEAGRNASQCGKIKANQGVQRMVAMLYALDQINQDPEVLPGIQLGAQILDTCSVETHALEQSLEFIKSVMTRGDDMTCSDGSRAVFQRQPVVAVIGAASSQVSVMVASMLQLFRVAQLEWNYVHAIADTGSYGERGMDSFRAAATEFGICIDGDVHKISRQWTDHQFEELILRMRNSNKARGVVMFVDEDNLRRFLRNLKRLIHSGQHPELKNYFWFVASDSWGVKLSVVHGFENIVSGAITIAPKARILPPYDEYFKSLGPVNTFLSEYWQAMNCSDRINENFGKCFKSIGHNFMQEAYVPFVVDAVKIVARAMHNYIQTYCSDVKWEHCHLQKVGFDGYQLQKFYRNISIFPNKPPLIDAKGDGVGQYDIFQLDKNGKYEKVGKWHTGRPIDLDLLQVRIGLQAIDGSIDLPVSMCSTPCDRGFYRAYQDQTCCWTCIPCDITTSIIVNETSCIQCPLGMVPNTDLDACRHIRPVHLEWDTAWALVPAVYSLCGIIATMFVVSVFIRYNSTPVVMASGRELCYCMLFGIALCYAVTFILVSKPTAYICAMSRVLIGLSMCSVYSAILVKTNRLARVFKPNSPVRPRCISPPAQVAICGSIVITQLIGSLVWLLVDPPDTSIMFPTRTEAVLTCKATASHLLISLAYNILLIIACTIYAFKTRKIPENFNETRLIGFTMYSTSILWLSFGPIYFATQNNFKIQITSLCMCISMSGTVALACFFAPKVYIVLWQPYKNVRNRHSAVGKLVNQQMRFISQLTTQPPQQYLPNDYTTNCTTSVADLTSTTIQTSEASCTARSTPLQSQPTVYRPSVTIANPPATDAKTTTANKRSSLVSYSKFNSQESQSLDHDLNSNHLTHDSSIPSEKEPLKDSMEESTSSHEDAPDERPTCLKRRSINNSFTYSPAQLILQEIGSSDFATFL